MSTSDYLRGPWQAVLSISGEIIESFGEVHTSDEVDICICRGTAIPVKNEDGALDWTNSFSGDDVIELWDELEYDEAAIRWAQVQAMTAGLNAAGSAA